MRPRSLLTTPPGHGGIDRRVDLGADREQLGEFGLVGIRHAAPGRAHHASHGGEEVKRLDVPARPITHRQTEKREVLRH